MTPAIIVRIVSWLVVFAAPVVSLGQPLPFLGFSLVSAMATHDRATGNRVVRWAVLAFVFESVYRVLPGTLSLAIISTAILEHILERTLRVDERALGSGTTSRIVRTGVRSGLWLVGLVTTSIAMGWLIHGDTASVAQLVSFWLRGATGGVLIAFALIVFPFIHRYPLPPKTTRVW